MKKIHLILALAFTMCLGAILGSSIGINPILSGVVITSVLIATAVPNKGVVSDNGLDLSLIRSQIEEYFKHYSTSIWNAILKGTDFEQYMKSISGKRNTYVTTAARRSEFLQAWQKGFQAKGDVEFAPYKNTIYDIKMDVLFDNLHELYYTYLAYLADETKTPDQYPIVKWLMDYHIIPGITEELRAMSVKGVYVAPTPGTAGASIASANGIFTIISNEVAEGNITPIAVGAITTSNIVEKYNKFNRDLPAEWRTKPGIIFVSADRLYDYREAYDAVRRTATDYNGMQNSLYGTQKTLVGLDDLNGSDRMLFTPTGPTGNLLKMYDKIVMPQPTVQLYNRDVKVLTDFARGWGFDTLDCVFVNDIPEDEE